MNKHPIIYTRTTSSTWIASDQIAALDALVAEHGRHGWRRFVEGQWYRGTAEGIGAVIYGMRNNRNQCHDALDLYTAMKADKVRVTRSIVVSKSKRIEESAILGANGSPRYVAVGLDDKGHRIAFSALATIEDVADWTSRVTAAATTDLDVAHLVDQATGTVVEAYDVETGKWVS